MEKYYSFSSYSYSVLNPLVFKDINGRDAIAEIDEKNKRINIQIHLNYSRYSKENKAGLRKNQIQFLKDLKEEVEELWSGNVGVNNEEYKINLIVELQEFSTFVEAVSSTEKNKGQNYVRNASAEDILHGDVGLGAQSRGLFITKDFSPRRYSASHEIGHLLGLPDLGQSNKSIMGYHSERGGPKASDRQEVLRNANLDFAIIGPQRIGGNER